MNENVQKHFDELVLKYSEERRWYNFYDNSDGPKDPNAYKRLKENKDKAQKALIEYVVSISGL